ncbi:MAG: hypothetical protein ACK5P3_07070 [Dolichospermum sp.]|jgi:hypothetical protein
MVRYADANAPYGLTQANKIVRVCFLYRIIAFNPTYEAMLNKVKVITG